MEVDKGTAFFSCPTLDMMSEKWPIVTLKKVIVGGPFRGFKGDHWDLAKWSIHGGWSI